MERCVGDRVPSPIDWKEVMKDFILYLPCVLHHLKWVHCHTICTHIFQNNIMGSLYWQLHVMVTVSKISPLLLVGPLHSFGILRVIWFVNNRLDFFIHHFTIPSSRLLALVYCKFQPDDTSFVIPLFLVWNRGEIMYEGKNSETSDTNACYGWYFSSFSTVSTPKPALWDLSDKGQCWDSLIFPLHVSGIQILSRYHPSYTLSLYWRLILIAV